MRAFRITRTPPLAAVIAVLGLPGAARAAPTAQEKVSVPRNSPDRRTGIGLTLGDPTGATLKHFFTFRHALQADLGWLPMHHGGGGLALDYLWHSRVLASGNGIDAIGYIGGGVGVGLWGRNNLGGYDGPHVGGDLADAPVHFAVMLRAPVLGMAWHWVDVPVDFAIEAAWSPFLIEVREARFGPAHGSFALKSRYYF